MFDNPKILLGLATVLAAIPIAIWLCLTIKEEKSSRKVMMLVFGFGCLTAPALLGLQVAWAGGTPLVAVMIPILAIMIIATRSSNKRVIYFLLLGLSVASLFVSELIIIREIRLPEFDPVRAIEKGASSGAIATILTLILFASLEENIKLYVVKTIDRKTLFVSKINDSIRFCIAAALGFSFVENIYYLYSWWPIISTGDLGRMYFFRSIFTTAAHMTYSGILGYYYGIGKFSIVINQQNIAAGNSDKLSLFIAKFFNLPPSEGLRQKTILKGLIIAISMHFTINYLLQLQEEKNIQILFPIVILTNIGMYLFLQYLLKRKAGHLILLVDPTTKKASTIAKKDEEVVVELLAMWLKDARYVDVIHICERLLQRDPDNNVVKLFKAKAMDQMDEKDVYKEILGTVIKTKNDLSANDKNIITKYISQKPKEELHPATQSPQKPEPEEKKTNGMEKYTSGDTFKL